ncbi:glucosamine-1-phosphate N-acetyltransferase [Halothece sp. PCC 7418]|uniref:bifunctional UDP-N-acetylglucosamine diphosphorylase/glucosamine-1-phosphate N-acetyltransferase GlmU n=1 Tax=Halothece sp. (strain PCC 7418) TaxID=65093 RepID=UPI0002A07069|nr:bifunctional UDP-N-acetylglucosamine diphosphorylase/glucosamine-1-phosphate N-acetyltransferase GlmU [Halothece sp. PCC 7418]AFZ45445.1 glucosamine-1-phosphate N-acetyltransferase [Halothece sp. PCC 7418]
MVAVAVLAAGRGTRMKSSLPKVLHPLGGKSMLERVLDSCALIEPSRYLVIVGYAAEEVKTSLKHWDHVEFVLQEQQLGTGHAVQQLLPALKGSDEDVLILNGDVPLLRQETLQQLLDTHQTNQNAATLLTAQLENPQGYGRVFCDDKNQVQEIIEDRDCTPEQKRNQRINAGVYCLNWQKLAEILPHLSAENDQKEYYLTDVFTSLSPVMAMDVADVKEISGINHRKHLADAYTTLQQRIKDKWLMAGVTLIDPDSITIDETVELSPDVTIEPQTHLRGNTVIASGCRIGPGSMIENSQLGEQVTVFYSVLTDSTVEAGTRIGPYAHLRGQARVGSGCRVGNFVEMKNTQLGEGCNVAHLSYLGDATLGTKVNVGAGTITANYDGVHKHQTHIGNYSKTGSNTVLVAPVRLGDEVTVAAGSVVTEDVPTDALVIARSRQVVKPGWRLNSDE